MDNSKDSKILQNQSLRVIVDTAGDACWLKLQDLRSGHEWPRVPLLALEVYDRAQQRMDRLVQYRIDQIHAAQDSIHIVVGDRMTASRSGFGCGCTKESCRC